jgi:hypothetical protein
MSESHERSEFRVEKRRAEAELTLSTGAVVRGCFFLAGSAAAHSGPERVGDLLNAEAGFFPFELAAQGLEGSRTPLYNRAQLVLVRLVEQTGEAQLDPGYDVATERHVSILMSNGATVSGAVRVYRPVGRDRLSDYARSSAPFRYVEAADATYIVNGAHIVELREISA